MNNIDKDILDLDVTIAKFLIPRLKKLKNLKNCYPESAGSMAKWHGILKKMIKAFEIIAKQGHLESVKNSSRDKIMLEGLELFAKHFTDLWT